MNPICKLKNLHEKFHQAFILWEQALHSYFNPEIFITNINATIQALRNITFALQNKKGLFPDFDKWYQPWQEQLKADKYMRWLCDSRTKIVHKDDFQINSFATIRVFNYTTTYLADYKIPIEMPLEAIAGMLLVDKKITIEQIRAENILEITRRWSTKDFKDLDILYVLLCTFPVFSNIIADAHRELNIPVKDCEFYVKENDSRFPEKLIYLIEYYPKQQRCQFSLKDLQQLTTVNYSKKIDESELLKAKEKYAEAQPIFEKKYDVQIHAYIDLAQQILAKDGYHRPMAFFTGKDGRHYPISLSFDTRADKYLAFAELAKIAKTNNIIHAIIIAESYIIPHENHKQFLSTFDVDKIENKRDCLNVYEITPTKTVVYLTPFTKNTDKTITFDKTTIADNYQLTSAMELIKAIEENGKD